MDFYGILLRGYLVLVHYTGKHEKKSGLESVFHTSQIS